MGGEKWTIRFARPRLMGSPPHGRGKGGFNGSAFQEVGITPAWAGKSKLAALLEAVTKDHPRMGGEKIRICPPRPVWEGSPPHGRGKEIEPSTIARTVGITPAWAGKRSPASNSRPLLKDHPRMGGEKVPVAEQASNGKGSPPHGRGKDSAGYFWLEGSRITPAWAGKSVFGDVPLHISRDHPRMGGEKTKKIP